MRWLVTAAVIATLAPLPGSSFQGGDGNQDDEGGYVDWQSQPGVVHSADLAPDTSFKGGSKENEPGDWQLATEGSGVNPGKANLLNAYSAAADPFLYLGFTREQSNGDTYVAFELNRDPRMWNNGHAEIPCRTTGDVLVAYTAHTGGAEIALQRWTTTEADSATGCARRGELATVSSLPAGSVQGALNDGTITNRLPGGAGSIPAGEFGEAAVNLTKVMEGAFGRRCFSFSSIWMHTRSSHSDSANMQDLIAPQRLSIQRCTASGVKFFDLDADGVRDPGEPGIPRFLVWADYDDDGRQDANEPFSVTDIRGRYVIKGIDPPGGTYTLRETLLSRPAATSWRCSFPNAGTAGGFGNRPGLFGCGWGPIDVTTTPSARNKDFGNWLPAFLSVRKRLFPAGDPGRFDLKVNDLAVVQSGGDSARAALAVRPGTYDISETGALGTNLADFRSAVACRSTPTRRRTLRPGTAWDGLVLRAGSQASCVFYNARNATPNPTPEIAIEKTGPLVAISGTVLSYTLRVTNPGVVAFPAGSVRVSDPNCDTQPRLVDKGSDRTPGTLDPGDTWTYQCAHKTPAPGDDCEASTVRNTATVEGDANGVTVGDEDAIVTTLVCRGTPPDPPLPPDPTPEPGPSPQPNPGPDQEPVVPPGPPPPAAGTGGIAGISAVSSRNCLTRASQLRLTGRRISGYGVSLDGRRLASRTVALLQRRSTPLNRVLAPGRHTLSVHVAFEPGSGTPPVTLTQHFTVCARETRVPSFTG